jgi:hypothetical protein
MQTELEQILSDAVIMGLLQKKLPPLTGRTMMLDYALSPKAAQLNETVLTAATKSQYCIRFVIIDPKVQKDILLGNATWDLCRENSALNELNNAGTDYQRPVTAQTPDGNILGSAIYRNGIVLVEFYVGNKTLPKNALTLLRQQIPHSEVKYSNSELLNAAKHT